MTATSLAAITYAEALIPLDHEENTVVPSRIPFQETLSAKNCIPEGISCNVTVVTAQRIGEHIEVSDCADVFAAVAIFN